MCKRESKARDGDVAAHEDDTASDPEAYRTRAPKRTRNERRAPYGVAPGLKTGSAAEPMGPCLALSPLRLDQPIRFLTLEPMVKQSLRILSSLISLTMSWTKRSER